MKLFYLIRNKDISGNSGTGVVAQGVEFDNGKCAMTWLTETLTMTTFDKFSDIELLHGHGGMTEVVTENDPRFDNCGELADDRIVELKKKKVV